MLDFPDKPVIDQTYQGPSGQLWRWTGNMWSAVRRPVLGVTDGSNAAPGEVGEFVDSGVVNIMSGGVVQSYNTFYNVMQISLSAGDWDVSAWAWAVATGAVNPTVTIQIDYSNTNSANLQSQLYYRAQNGGLSSVSTSDGPRRFNLTVTTTMCLWFAVGGNWAGGFGQIYARRMR